MSESKSEVINRYFNENRFDDLKKIKSKMESSVSPEKHQKYIKLINEKLEQFYEISEEEEKPLKKTVKMAQNSSEENVEEKYFNHPKRTKSIRKDKLLPIDFNSLKIGDNIYYRISSKKTNKIRNGIYLGHYLDIFVVSKNDKNSLILEKRKYIILK